MKKRLLIEVHVGKRYGISRLNCDGAGQVKDVMIDNTRYNRISSQAKKKVWREHLEEHFEKLTNNTMEHVYRTRAIKDVFEKEFLSSENDLYKEHADEMAAFIVISILNCSLEEKVGFETTPQILIVTKYDIKDIVDAFCEVVKTAEDWENVKKSATETAKKNSKKTNKENTEETTATFKNITDLITKKLPLRSYGVECSLFGRMTTSGVMETVESAVCVNHSYSFGKASLDTDYFTVVDNYLSSMKSDLASGQSGAGYLDEKEFATHVYYEYASIDVGKFYENLTKGVDMTDEENVERIRTAVTEAVTCLVHDIACSAPSGGQNSFASCPDPVGVYITVREYGAGRTADTYCIKEMTKKGTGAAKSETDKFLNALSEFMNGAFSNTTDYIKRIYTGEEPERMTGAESMSWKEAVDTIGELVHERF